MASNRLAVIEKYGDGTCEDSRPSRSRTSSLEFHYTRKHLAPYITPETRILEVGCATGYYGMYYADKCRQYVGVDIVPGNIEFFRRKIQAAGLTNVSCQVGDATRLSDIDDASFDVVLCLGPVYHLPAAEVDQVFAQCKRVCRSGGIIAFAYINKIGVYVGGCVHDDWRHIYPNAQTNQLVLRENTDDQHPGLFYYTTPEDMETLARQHGLIKVCNLATDSMITMKIVDEMSEERFRIMQPLLDEMMTHESCTGMGNHALLICEKADEKRIWSVSG